MRAVAKIVLAVAIISVVAVVVLGGLQLQFSINSLHLRVKDISVNLGTSNVTIALTFDFQNPSLLPVYVVDMPFAVELAEYRLGKGTVNVPLIVPGNGRMETVGRLQIPYSQVPSATLAALKQYLELRTLKYKILGTITLKVILFNVNLPFEMQGEVFKG
jgi:LEA14-like dessication related protein